MNWDLAGKKKQAERSPESTGLEPGCAWHLRETPIPLGLVPTCRVGPGAKGKVGLCLGRFEHYANGSELILEVKGGHTIGSKEITKLRGPGKPLKVHLFLCSTWYVW